MKIESDDITFEWDDNKNLINISKHGIDFRTAIRVFSDDDRIEFYDEKHSQYEDRYLTIGLIDNIMILAAVSYTERKGALRIISARKATKEERGMYNDR